MSLASHAVGRLRRLYRNFVAPSGDTNVALSVPPGCLGGAHLPPLLEALEPRLLLDSSGVWHQVQMDGGTYDINLSTTGIVEDLRGHPLTAAHFDQGLVTSIWITEHGTGDGINNATLAEQVLTTAQNALYLAQTPNVYDDVISTFIDAGHLSILIARNGYSYRCLEGYQNLGMLVTLMDQPIARRAYYYDVITEFVTQPDRYEWLMQDGEAVSKTLRDFAHGASFANDRAQWLVSQLADFYGVVGSVLSFPLDSELAEDVFNVADVWGRRAKFLQKTGTVFATASLLGTVSADALRMILIDTLLLKPEADARFDALCEFRAWYQTLPAQMQDQAFLDAFSDFSSHWAAVTENHAAYLGDALQNLLSNPHAVVDAVKLAKSWTSAIQAGGIPGTLAKASGGYLYALDWGLYWFDKLNNANKSATAATLSYYLALFLRDPCKSEIDVGQPFSEQIIERNSALASMISYGGHSFYSNLAESFRTSVFSEKDWLIYGLTWLGSLPGWCDTVTEKFSYFDGLAYERLWTPSAGPQYTQYILPHWDYYLPLFEHAETADLHVVSTVGNPVGSAHAGEPIGLDVTIENRNRSGPLGPLMSA